MLLSGFVCVPGGLGGVEVVGGKFPGSKVSTPVSCLGIVEVEVDGGVVVLGGLEWSVSEVSGVAGTAGLGEAPLFSSELGWVMFGSVAPLLFVVGTGILFSGLVFEYQTKAAPPKTTNKTRTPTISFVLLVDGAVFNMFSSIIYYYLI
ncbi:MAG: hypothetical protein A2534_01410 [Candidatus Magasanikbacteria bacterium RIFOXYD2_FULL_39_9]|nr:MAG: hypothetical protein A2534_01410 [Candidatus Magasanikbacteria bacterium RIFOXYD2_FULL_39_9]